MNLPEGTLDSWSELCHQFTGCHAIQQHPGESLRSFVQRFSQIRNIIPRISNASVVVAFRQGVRDEKMLEKLVTHDIHDVSVLFSRADKCAKVAEGHAWHSPITQAVKGESKPNAGIQAQGGGSNNNNNKKEEYWRQPTANRSTHRRSCSGGCGPWGAKRQQTPHQLSNSDDGSTKCLVHNSTRHTASECREIKKLTEQFCDKMQERHQDDASFRQQEGK
jgi:hypothetical protein